MNLVILQGYVGGEIETRRLENGTPVAKFSVATSKSYKDKNDEWQTVTTWHTVIAWRSLAEKVEKWAKRGSFVTIQGTISLRDYDRKVKSPGGEEFTVKSTSIEIIADTLDIKEVLKKDANANTAEVPVAETTHVPAGENEEDLF